MSFFNLYNHIFLRAAVCIPEVRVADPEFNAAQTVALLREAEQARAALAVCPELGISAYSCEDLFHRQALLDASIAGLARVLEQTRELPLAAVVGLPLRLDGMRTKTFGQAAERHREALGIPCLDWRKDMEPMIAEMDREVRRGVKTIVYNDPDWGYAGHAFADVRVAHTPAVESASRAAR